MEIKRGVDADTLMLEGFLAVTNYSKRVFWYLFKGENKHPTSLIRSKSGQVIISKSGIILNPKDLEEYGYWTKQRVADLLPLNYSIHPGEASPAEIVMDSLANFSVHHPQEKVYLHLNKAAYHQSEEILFKAYLVDAHSHEPFVQSKVIHIELINSTGKIVDSLMLHTSKGSHGKFQLGRQKLSGVYHIRAYTRYMSNQDSSFLFQKAITVGGEMLHQSINSSLINASQIFAQKLAPRVELICFPEGGDLIHGLKSRVACEVRSNQNHLEQLEFTIKDEKDQTLSAFNTNHIGLGSFTINPDYNKTYTIHCKVADTTFNFRLPKVKQHGLTMSIKEQDEAFRINIGMSAQEEAKAFILGHTRGNITFYAPVVSKNQVLVLPKHTLPPGIQHFTLFDSQGLPQAERLVLNNAGIKDDVLSMQAKLEGNILRRKVELVLSLPDSINNPDEATLSLSLNNAAINMHPKLGENIINYLYLNSDLDTSIPLPEKYFGTRSVQSREELELILLTKAWRRFSWDKILNGSPRPMVIPQTGFSVSGKVTAADNPRTPVEALVMLNSLDKDFFLAQTLTDKEGRFHFENLPFMDSSLLVFQARMTSNLEEGDEIKLSGNRMLDIELSNFSRPPVTILRDTKPITNEEGELWEEYVNEANKSIPAQSGDLQLDTVEITERRRPDLRLYNIYDLNKLDWVPQTAAGTELIGMLKPGNRYELSTMDNTLYYVGIIQGKETRIEVKFYINGMEKSYFEYRTLNADLIDYIGINDWVITVYTRRNGPRSREKELEKGIITYLHPGYHISATSYSNLSENFTLSPARPQLTSAVFWQANVSFDSSGKANLSIEIPPEIPAIEIRAEGITPDGIPLFKNKRMLISQ